MPGDAWDAWECLGMHVDAWDGCIASSGVPSHAANANAYNPRHGMVNAYYGNGIQLSLHGWDMAALTPHRGNTQHALAWGNAQVLKPNGIAYACVGTHWNRIVMHCNELTCWSRITVHCNVNT